MNTPSEWADHPLAADHPVAAELSRHKAGRVWLARLPQLIEQVRDEWALRLGRPVIGGSCSWVAPAEMPDGTRAIVKIGFPHREMYREADALRLWDGHGAIRLLAHDAERHALLLERCEPGLELGDDAAPAEQRLLTGCQVLRQLWVDPGAVNFERVADVTAQWADLVDERMERIKPGYDPGLVREGASLLRRLPGSATQSVVVHGDFNPGNVLAAQREPWLAIDAKPMAGDPAYDPWPLIEQIDDPFAHADPAKTLRQRINLVADALGEDPQRIVSWAVARRVETALWAAHHGRVAGGLGVMREAAVLARL